MKPSESIFRLVQGSPGRPPSEYRNRLNLPADVFDSSLAALVEAELLNESDAGLAPAALPEKNFAWPGPDHPQPSRVQLSADQVIVLERACSKLERAAASAQLARAQLENAQIRFTVAKTEFDMVCVGLGIDCAKEFTLDEEHRVIYAPPEASPHPLSEATLPAGLVE